MQTLKSFTMFDNVGEPYTSDMFSCISYSQSGSDIVLEVGGNGSDFDIEIQGQCNVKDNLIWTSISLVNLNDFTTSVSITKNGIYAGSVNGLTRIRGEVKNINRGNLTVFGKITN